MAAPVPAVRIAPVGLKLKDGFRTLITFSADTNISFWEKKVTPLGLDGREPIDQTTMWNDLYITKYPRALREITDGSITVAYDPAVYSQITEILNIVNTITYTFSDQSTVAAYGWLQKFEPQEVEEGSQPEAKITIVHSGWDDVNKVEAGIAIASIAGT